jgi:hypothetical protein
VHRLYCDHDVTYLTLKRTSENTPSPHFGA